MATFYHAGFSNLDTGELTALTSSSDSTIVLSILVANVDGTNPADVTFTHTNSSDTLLNHIAKTIVVPADSNVDLIGNKYIVPSGHKFKVSASSSGALDLAILYVEV